MRVLVTGHHGYIGSVLAPMLRDAGHDVVGLDTFFYRGCDFGERASSSRRSRSTSATSRRPISRDSTRSSISPLSRTIRSATSTPTGRTTINRDGHDRARARLRRRQACGASSSRRRARCTAPSGGDDALDESAPLRPLTPYAESKVAAEEALRELAGDGFSPVSMRNATVYGASPRLRLDIVLNNLVAWAHTTGAIRLQSDGTSWRPLVHVQDVARATLVLCSMRRRTLVAGEAFNIGSGEQNYRIRELAEIVHRAASPTARSRSRKERRPIRGATASTSRSSRGRSPTSASSGRRSVARTSSRAHTSPSEWTRVSSSGHRYVRLNQLKRLLDSGRLDDGLRWVSATAHA